MSTLITKFHSGVDKYADKEEDLLLDHFMNNSVIHDPQDTTYYLLTPERENLLSWYPFKRGKILEVGCGCGCLTGILCNAANEVVSIDQSCKRAMITHYRHKDRENLTVYAGNIEEIPFKDQFDYVVVVGVLEYARMFFAQTPADQKFLRIIRKCLKKDGILLLAIENRYGLKYFSGANEDHLNRKYVSIEGYDNEKVQTYGQKELEELLQRTGFPCKTVYYPFPDYKLPTVIFSDDRKPNEAEAGGLKDYLYGQEAVFNLSRAAQGLFFENDALGLMANSFLIEAGTEISKFSTISYAKFNPKRQKKYKIYTVLDNGGISGRSEKQKQRYIKYPCTEEAKSHLKRYYEINKKMIRNGMPVLPVYPMADGNAWYSLRGDAISVPERIRKIWYREGKYGVEQEIKRIIEWLRALSKYERLTHPIVPELVNCYPDGTNIICFGLMDLNANNMLFDEKIGYFLIDQEWECDKQIPVDYAIMCSLGYLFTGSAVIRNLYNLDELLNSYGVEGEKKTILEKITTEYFQNIIHQYDVESNKFFSQLEKYSIASAPEDAQKQLCEMHEEIARLSKEYNRVLQLFETSNQQVSELSGEYNRVLQLLQENQKQNASCKEDYRRLEKKYGDLYKNYIRLKEENQVLKQESNHLNEIINNSPVNRLKRRFMKKDNK